METITQIFNNLNTLSTFIYLFKTNIEPFTLLKFFPVELNNFINNLEFITLLNNCIDSISKLNDYVNKNIKLIKKYTHKKHKPPKKRYSLC